jgi:peptidoglycan hydrolase CwlO-like protein
LVTQFYTDKITNYENKISKLDSQFADLIAKYEAECKNHNNTKEDLNKLKIKFEGIKSLFN